VLLIIYREFLSACEDLLVEHNVPNDSRLCTIFRVKEKWAWACVREIFTAGMRSTQLSENFHYLIGNASQHGTAHQQGAASQHGAAYQYGAASLHLYFK
jgi:hypothetical protein